MKKLKDIEEMKVRYPNESNFCFEQMFWKNVLEEMLWARMRKKD